MEWNVVFFVNSLLLGVGLAMDAFSVSLADGLHEPRMRYRKMCMIAGVFAGFQALMPILGWICVKTVVQFFCQFERWIPWIALALLLFIGSKMLKEGICGENTEEEYAGVGMTTLLVQGIATSIDALSVGFTISGYGLAMALVCAEIIAIVTFVICMGGLFVGKSVGMQFSGKASIFGGIILIIIGIEIFVTGVL